MPQTERTHVHHLFDTTHKSDVLVAPLCAQHHEGPLGFHGLGEREFNRRYRLDELHLLEATIKRLA